MRDTAPVRPDEQLETGDPYPRWESVVQVTTLPGFFTREQVVERYAVKTGRDVSQIAFYEIFAIYKTTVVVQRIALTLAAKSGL